jgi:hypothetical protein
MVPKFDSFEEFFPYYVAQHSRAGTRWAHLAGTLSGFATGGTLAARGRWRGLLLTPVISYGIAWWSHFAIEKNRPATWGHPVWSLRGDFRMIRLMVNGRDRELADLARQHQRTAPVIELRARDSAA